LLAHNNVSRAKRSTRGKRYNWPNLDCGADGHPIPFGEPHIRTFIITYAVPRQSCFLSRNLLLGPSLTFPSFLFFFFRDIYSEQGININNGGYGTFTVEEIRFVAPYPSSIPESAFLPERSA
jgi:hypothetical protein